ncbi:hypothetical protein IWW40_003798 [Coemansia sp. RSA 1250]|nr:hypothetical protein IWW40_003798 [Coemansia sp. RSA 1250]
MQVGRVAARWPHEASSIGADYSVKYPYAFTKLSISPYGRDVVLGGQEGLAIVDLDFPLSPPRTIPVDSFWKISKVAWCPSLQHHGWVATAVNQTLLIHDIGHASSQPMQTVRAHPMAITDIAWAPQMPSWIGTTSIDPVIKIWDVRRDQKPVWYFSRWEPADFLAFNNVHRHRLATAHRNKIAIWDIRYGSTPVMTLDDAHSDDISSISWHPTKEDVLVSSSQDGTVKRWSMEAGRPQNDYVHAFGHEVVGAEYLPFGEGLVVRQRAPDNTVWLVRDDAQLAVVHQFAGHTGAVLGAQWRLQQRGRARNQLVTWGRDQVLRVWTVGEHTVAAVGGKSVPAEVPAGTAPVPSFATNFLRPHDLLHLYDQRALPSELLLAAAANGNATTWHELSRASESRLSTPDDGTGARKAAQTWSSGSRQRASTTDEHSSDDEDDDDARRGGWESEVVETVRRYSASRTVALLHVSSDARTCRIEAGVPWATRDTAEVSIAFPARYPHAAAVVNVETLGAAFGSRATIIERMRAAASQCAAQGIEAIDHCLYTLLLALLGGIRTRRARGARVAAEDLARLPLPPTPLGPFKVSGGIGSTSADSTSELSDESAARLDSEEDSDNDDASFAWGYDDMDVLYSSDSQFESVSTPQQRARHRERFEAHVPFPRLCGGVFSGPGQLVCFFASIYALDRVPEPSAGAAAREQRRRDMVQQLRVQSKPRNYRKLEYYQNMVQFGSLNKAPLMSYGTRTGLGRGMGDSDDDTAAADRDEVQDEEVPRYYFRQQAGRPALSAGGSDPADKTYFRPVTIAYPGAGIGNLALICSVDADHCADRRLAQLFVLTGPSTEWVCRHNARIAVLHERTDLAHVWTLLACLLAPVTLTIPTGTATVAHSLWISNPPVIKWLRAVMARFRRRGDVQTLALLSCVLSKALAEAAVSSAPETSSVDADLPPWMASTTRLPSDMPNLTTNGEVARNVSFHLPPSSAASPSTSIAMAAAAAAATADSLGLVVESQLLRDVAASQPVTRPSPHTPPASAASLVLDADELRPSLFSAADQSTNGSTPLYNSSQPRPPGSPQILKELDSEDIKQNELMMMADGPDDILPQAELSTSDKPEMKAYRTSSDQLPEHAAVAAGTSPTGPESGENIWRRLRSNVLGRVHTVGGYANGTAAATVASNDIDVAETAATAATEAATETSSAPGADTELGSDSGRLLARHGMAANMRTVFSASNYDASASAAQARRKERIYMHIKRDFERLHTRMTVHKSDDRESELGHAVEAGGLRGQSAYLDHWKLLYARILYKWQMDEKAVEVLKYMQDSTLRSRYNEMHCQPSVPQHDNLPRIGNPLLAIKSAGMKRTRSGTATPTLAERPKSQRRDKLSEQPEMADPDTLHDILDAEVPGEPMGAPWLSCTWCHEYVHGRALICHACGHGGHQEHMQRWFRIVRKQLLHTGITAAQYSHFASNSSSTSNLLRRGMSTQQPHDPDNSTDPLASAVPSVVTATDVSRSLVPSPFMSTTDLPRTNSSDRLHFLSQPLEASFSDGTDSDYLRNSSGLHIRTHGPSALSRQLSRDSLSSDMSGHNSDDPTFNSAADVVAASRLSLNSLSENMLQGSWETSDAESDDRLRPTQRVMLRHELRGLSFVEPTELLDLEHHHDEGAAMLRRGIPTCPSGCGCNCLYESYKLII